MITVCAISRTVYNRVDTNQTGLEMSKKETTRLYKKLYPRLTVARDTILYHISVVYERSWRTVLTIEYK